MTDQSNPRISQHSFHLQHVSPFPADENEQLSRGDEYTLGNDSSLSDEEPLLWQNQVVENPVSPPFARTSKASLTWFNCLALVVSIQIGSGIFSTPAFISSQVSSPVGAILVWTAAGVLVWTGASCFNELGTNISRNGGMQEYLQTGYGDFAGFLFSSAWIAIVRPCSVAMIAMVFSDHTNRILLQELGIPNHWIIHKSMALIGLWILTLINCMGIKTGATVANWFFLLKVVLLLSFVLAGLVECVRMRGGYLIGNSEADPPLISENLDGDYGELRHSVWDVLGQYVSAGLAALWVYGGWESLGFVAAEMENPTRDMPRVLNSAMAMVTTGFTFTATALYIVLPVSVVRENDTPAITFAEVLYGRTGFLIYTLAISISALGAINANIFAVSRLVDAAAQRNYLPAFLATSNQEIAGQDGTSQMRWKHLWPSFLTACTTEFARRTANHRVERKIPIYSILLTSILISIYILGGSFRGLLTFIGLIEYIVFMSTVLVLVPLRRSQSANKDVLSSRSPSIMPTYRTYTANIFAFCGLSLFLIVRGIVTDPRQGAAIMIFSAIVYAVWKWKLSTK